MKRRRERSRRVNTLRLWDWSEATRAVPYLHSVIGSLREHWLEVTNAERRLDRLDQQKGLPNRQQLMDRHGIDDELARARSKFDDALAELNGIDVFLLDAVQGLALIPFRKEDDLAWYVFDHFAPRGLTGWRYHHDPIEECRPLNTLPKPAANGAAAT